MSPLTAASNTLVGNRRLSQSAIETGALAVAAVVAPSCVAAAPIVATVPGSSERRDRKIGVRTIANNPEAISMRRNNRNVRMASLPTDFATAPLIVASR